MSAADPPPRKLAAKVVLDVAADVPHRLITEATERGLAAARAALPRAVVQAQGSLSGLRDGRRRVRIDLDVRGEPADPAWAREAADACEAAFCDRVETKGHERPQPPAA